MGCPHWLLALTIPFSRSDRARTTAEALVPGGPKDCSGQIAPLASFLRFAGGPGEAPRRKKDPTRQAQKRQRAEPASARTETPKPSPAPSQRGTMRPGGMRARCPGRGRPGARSRWGSARGTASSAPVLVWFPGSPPGCPVGGGAGCPTGEGPRGTDRWHAGNHPVLRMPPGARSPTGFPLPPSPWAKGACAAC